MPVLNIRNLPAEVHARLRMRAALAHRSMEAEARAILTEACLSATEPRPAHELPDWVDKLYGRRKPIDVLDDPQLLTIPPNSCKNCCTPVFFFCSTLPNLDTFIRILLIVTRSKERVYLSV